MSTAVDEDFRAFVVARWPDLEAVARVVVLDPERARRATTEALAGLSRRWRVAVDDGRPGAEARGAVLRAAVAAAGPARAGGGRRRPAAAEVVGALDPSTAAPPLWEDDGPSEDDAVRAALLTTLAAGEALDRALVAASLLWSLGPAEVAGLLDLPAADLARRDAAVRDRLARAHHEAVSEASGGSGGSSGGWFERDLEDAVTGLLHGQGDPPDPAGLVAERSGRVRRRQLVLGGVAALAVAGVGGAALLRDDPPPTPAGPKPPPGPQDPSWRRTATWAARGPLAADPQALALVNSTGPFGSRVLWAGDLGTRRLVISTYPGTVDLDGTEVSVWVGASGQDVRSLQQANLAMTGIYGVDDLVVVALPDGPDDAATSLLVVLTTPTVASAEVSDYLDPKPDGTVDREWAPVPLTDGVSATVRDVPVGAALRVRTAGREQPPVSTVVPFADLSTDVLTPEGLVDGAQELVASVTGIAASRLRTTVTVDETLAGRVFDEGEGDCRVVVVRTRLPNGTVAVSAAVTDVADDAVEAGGAMLFRSAGIVPPERLADPLTTRVGDLRSGVGRYLVVAPGAERVQLISTSPDGYPVSKVIRTHGRDAVVVNVVNADLASQYRVITRDARGRKTFDDVPYDPPWLLGI